MKIVLDFADSYDMLRHGDVVLCAVSGGADSMCLLNILKNASGPGGFSVRAMHYNHKLRGESSDRDEAFVREYCKQEGIELYTGSGDVSGYAAKRGIGIEEAARDMRYSFFRETLQEHGATKVATAHNADDNAETVLMNMARGSGLTGLCGIPPLRDIYIRPLLTVTRARIENYLSENCIPYIQDETNFEPIYTRNKIRLNVLPELVSIYPEFINSVTANSRLLKKDEDFLMELASDYLSDAKVIGSEDQGYTVVINAAELRKLRFSISSRVIRRVASMYEVSLSSVHVDDILNLGAASSPSGRLNLPGGLIVYRDYSELVFSMSAPEISSFDAKTLICGQWTPIPELGMEFFCGTTSNAEKINTSFNTFFFKKDRICGNIVVRPRLAGDKIELLGRKGTKTIKKLLIEMKIPVYQRDGIPLICDKSAVLAIPGIGISSNHASADMKSVGGEDDLIISYRSIE